MPDVDLWDDAYLSLDDARWLAALAGRADAYEQAYASLLDALACGDHERAACLLDTMQRLIRRPEAPHA
jgi:hypothetical protein